MAHKNEDSMYEIHMPPFKDLKKSEDLNKILDDIAANRNCSRSDVVRDAIKKMQQKASDGGSAI